MSSNHVAAQKSHAGYDGVPKPECAEAISILKDLEKSKSVREFSYLLEPSVAPEGETVQQIQLFPGASLSPSS